MVSITLPSETADTYRVVRRIPAPGRSVVPALAVAAMVSAGGDVLEQILVKVNGTPITKTELEQRQLAALKRETGGNPLWAEVRSNPTLGEAVERLTGRVVAEAIDELLVVQRAGELGYGVSEADLEAALREFKSSAGVATDDEFRDLLAREGLDLPRLRELLRRQILIQTVREAEVFRRLTVGEDEARAFFAGRRTQFARPASVTFREIVVALPPEEAAQRDPKMRAARDGALIRIVAARDRIRSGGDFAEVAARYSEAASREAGGLVGPVSPGDLAPEVRTALAQLGEGVQSDPVKIQGAYVLLKLERAEPAVALSFDNVRVEVVESLLGEKRRAAMETYLARLRAAAIIEWKNGELRQLYERHLGG
jgi:parvulin-like peptidyl-prolyl isomerase